MRQFTIGDRKQIASKKQLEDIELQELKKKFENENSNNWFDSADNRTKSRSCTDDFSYLLQQFIFKKLEEKYASDWIKNSKSILGDRVNYHLDGSPVVDVISGYRICHCFKNWIFNDYMPPKGNLTLIHLLNLIKGTRNGLDFHGNSGTPKEAEILVRDVTRLVEFLKCIELEPTQRMLDIVEGKQPNKPPLISEQSESECVTPFLNDTAQDHEIEETSNSGIEIPADNERVQESPLEDECHLADSDAMSLAPESQRLLSREKPTTPNTLEKTDFEINQSPLNKKVYIAAGLVILILSSIYLFKAESGPTVNQITASWEQYSIGNVSPSFENQISESNMKSFYESLPGRIDLDLEQYQDALRLATFFSFFPDSEISAKFALITFKQAAYTTADPQEKEAALEGFRLVLDNSGAFFSDSDKRDYEYFLNYEFNSDNDSHIVKVRDPK